MAAVGGAVNLSASTAGTAPFAYQWFKNGGMVLGATNSALTLASAGVTNSGVYYVVVTNAFGMNISQPATVTVGTPQLLAWGYNGYGQLGDGTMTSKDSPESVASNVVAAVAGGDHIPVFEKRRFTLWVVGYNGDGELGDGTTTDKHLPESVASNVVAVAAGAWHSLYLKSDGTLWAMGHNAYGQLGDGTTTPRNSPVSVASNVVAVAAGGDHSLYLKSDGTLWAMGYNNFGQLGDGTMTSRSTGRVRGQQCGGGGSGSLSFPVFEERRHVVGDGRQWRRRVGRRDHDSTGTTRSRLRWPAMWWPLAAGDYHSLFCEGRRHVVGDGPEHATASWAMGPRPTGAMQYPWPAMWWRWRRESSIPCI